MIGVIFKVSEKDPRAIECNGWIMVFPSPELAKLAAAAPTLLNACQAALEDGNEYKLSEFIKNNLKNAIIIAGDTPWQPGDVS